MGPNSLKMKLFSTVLPVPQVEFEQLKWCQKKLTSTNTLGIAKLKHLQVKRGKCQVKG